MEVKSHIGTATAISVHIFKNKNLANDNKEDNDDARAKYTLHASPRPLSCRFTPNMKVVISLGVGSRRCG